jgi:hypothetical protein
MLAPQPAAATLWPVNPQLELCNFYLQILGMMYHRDELLLRMMTREMKMPVMATKDRLRDREEREMWMWVKAQVV